MDSSPAPLPSGFGQACSAITRGIAESLDFSEILGRIGAGVHADLRRHPRRALPSPTLPPEKISLEAVEREMIEQAMAQANNNKSEAARLLGLTRAKR